MTMTTRTWDRARRRASGIAAASVLTAALTIVGLVGFGVPDAWWPQTGQAFAASPAPSPSVKDDPCDLVVGPAKDYCTSGHAQAAAPAPKFDATDAWMILPPAAGLLGMAVYRLSARRRS
ncbi:hypothetical protein P8605_02555 [Streptomyces sp. T-3]|nr:hypothetical protein [Streptomyces sp. T-3]